MVIKPKWFSFNCFKKKSIFSVFDFSYVPRSRSFGKNAQTTLLRECIFETNVPAVYRQGGTAGI